MTIGEVIEMHHIIAWALECEQVPQEHLFTRRKYHKLAVARRRIVSVARCETGLSYPALGRALELDHSACVRLDRHLERNGADDRIWLDEYKTWKENHNAKLD